jgi:hypothetical protein
MGIVVSMLLITVGAIMRFAVSAKGRGFNVHTTGVVLLAVGALGAVLSVAFWASWGGFGQGGFGRRTTVVGTQGTVVGGGTTIVDSERTVVREREIL